MAMQFWTAFGASLVAGLVTAIGIHTIRHFEDWGRRYSIYFVCFSGFIPLSTVPFTRSRSP